MSRRIKKRIVVTGDLVCCSALHVGGMETGTGADLALSVDGGGNYCIPGTSLAGAFRSWCRAAFDDDRVKAVFGFQPDPRAVVDEKGHASAIHIDDASLTARPELRDGVGTDRVSGTAAARIKFSREVLPSGTRLPLKMMLEVPSDDWPGMELFNALVLALEHGDIQVGAAVTRGLGRVRLEKATIKHQDFATAAGVLNVLRHGGNDIKNSIPSTSRRIKPSIQIKIGWKPVGPLMVKASADGMIIDTLPLLAEHGGALRLALPGSSIKGVLRSHAERIMETLAPRIGPKDVFNTQIATHALAGVLFGARNDEVHDKGRDDRRPRLGLAAVAVSDSHSRNLQLSADTLKLLLSVPKVNDRDDLAWLFDQGHFQPKRPVDGQGAFDGPFLEPAVRIAIDRWTGAPAQGALFSVLEPWNVEWDEIVLDVDPARLAAARSIAREKNAPLAAVALLLLVLRDFSTGTIPLGFGTNRGFGSVLVEEVRISTAGIGRAGDNRGDHAALLDDLSTSNSILIKDGNLQADQQLLDQIETAWRDHLSPPASKPGGEIT